MTPPTLDEVSVVISSAIVAERIGVPAAIRLRLNSKTPRSCPIVGSVNQRSLIDWLVVSTASKVPSRLRSATVPSATVTNGMLSTLGRFTALIVIETVAMLL